MTNRSSIAIFGSRDVDRDPARTLFEQHLASFVDQGRTWVLAGTRGIDEWAMEWLLERTEVCWAVVPHTRFDQPKSIQSRLEQADRVIELQLPGRKSARAFRNRYMVDLCGIVIGFRSGKGSGTQTILKYALRNQKEVHAIPVLTTIDAEQGSPAEAELARNWPR
jgi:predicted Rossmann fold nucleotide-binding protein DprA/Smf involved in DNA uptake